MTGGVADDATGGVAVTGGVALIFGKAESGGNARVGVGAANSSTMILLGGGVGGIGPKVTVGEGDSLVSFFADTEPEVATGAGGAVAVTGGVADDATGGVAVTGGVALIFGKAESGGNARVGVGAANPSTMILLGDGVGGFDPKDTVDVESDSLVSFFADTEPEIATGAGGGATGAVTGGVADDATGGVAVTGGVALIFGRADSGGSVRVGGAAADSSTLILLGGGVGGIDPKDTVDVESDSLVSFFADTEPEIATGAGGGATGAVTGGATATGGADCAATGGVAVDLAIVGGGVTAARPSSIRLDAGEVGIAVLPVIG